MKKIFLALMIFLIAGTALGDKVFIPACLPEPADSARWFWFYQNSNTAIAYTGYRDSVQCYDTTFTLPTALGDIADTGYYFVLLIYSSGDDSGASWVFEVGNASITSWFLPAWLSEPADSCQWFLYYKDDSIPIDTGIKYTNSQRVDTTLTLPSADSCYWAELRIWDDGSDTNSSWNWYHSPSTSKIISSTSDTLAIARAVTRYLVDSAVSRTDVFYGPSASGSGAYTHYTLVKDSGATPDSTLTGITVYCYNSVGSFLGEQRTKSGGVNSWSKDSGGYIFKVADARYAQADSVVDTVTTNGDTTEIYLYDNADANICRVYGYIINGSGDFVYGATVNFSLPASVKMNTCDSSIIVKNYVMTTTNTNGYFYTDLIRSSCLDDKKYKVEVYYNDILYTKGIYLTVPDSTTYKLNF